MNDQAESLRRIVDPQTSSEDAKVIAVVSGKGGVGKSNVCLNFAISLAKTGKKVIIFDLDIGMANVDILMGLTPSYNIMDLLDSQMTIWEIIEKGPEGISYIAGGSGFSDFVELNDDRMERFFSQLELLGQHFDYILLDMGAGATKSSIEFVLAANDVFIITTPEPPAITDAYAMMKYIFLHDQEKPLFLIVNRADTPEEGMRTIKSFQRVALQFLQKDLQALGFIPLDQHVTKAVKSQKPFVLMDEHAKASKALLSIVSKYLGTDIDTTSRFDHFLFKVKNLFKQRMK